MTVARVARRLAVLLAAGLPPPTAWRHLADDGAGLAGVAEVRDGGPEFRIADGDGGVASLAAAWSVATATGAPLAATLDRLAGVLDAEESARRDIAEALAGPRATARLVLALPPVGLIGAALTGVDVAGALLGTPVGWACLGVGVALLVVARRWMARLVAAARVAPPAPGLARELVAIALSGGGSADAALDHAANALTRVGLPPDAGAAATVDFARRAGVPAAHLLRAEAAAERREAASAARERAVVLGTRLLLPLGACVLPAFVALGVAPVLLALVGGAVAGI